MTTFVVLPNGPEGSSKRVVPFSLIPQHVYIHRIYLFILNVFECKHY